MDLFKVALLSFGSVFFLFILTKIMGNKEISQLSMFDYIIGITIGSIAAEMSTALESDFMQPLLAMAIYAITSVIISVLSCKSLKFRRLISGPSLILFDNGEIYKKNFKKAKLDINEFLMLCRTSGYFNLSDIQTAIMEVNGKISFLPKSEKRPSNPTDFNIMPIQERITVNVILDGQILKENLYYTGNDELWLQKNLVSQNIKNVSDVFLATCDYNNCLSIYLNKNLENNHDFFD